MEFASNPPDGVGSFCGQLQSSVAAVLDALAPLKTRTKRGREPATVVGCLMPMSPPPSEHHEN